MVKSKNQTDLKFISELLKKFGVSSRIMQIEEIEDYGMSILIKVVDKGYI